ncbi:MAG: peptidoglycan editing factor PgeF [Zetaproteobacteria bacterium CG06_land_8_20_14_3_00_59_53]|nr:MAG: hypothetical protein AUK36_01365 [Zetaproteobacteria bacterium CG2_30_59_37]PIO90910.1 MAG: hypothetical protein COX56_00190 [Zetaproteobacteria bacterium CG23_combo_of_CG06-09_8_20_14_all_59_86]PIQ64120.1 MAG: hypothetical protein COV97_10960 [Zetaproteobacteria bacterium CG11_big_fil_rev_8_21_14_0_20_59_439]PIU71092.1 MAG: peptidoglycan editing factor PgeF [Zetaproteobacteria bacterium CG06_land_8_20_14_3_00_59_53]PIU96085.1 MAG: peptidoglycan editing factor PgeF [Zetaproteobacteria b
MPDPCHLRSELFASHGLHGIVSLRTGGESNAPFDSMNLADNTGDDPAIVERNLRTLLAESGIALEPHRARQIHGCGVLHCRAAGRMHDSEADILLSVDGSPVAVRVADCTPVLLADPYSGLVAAVHAGWRGTEANVVGHAVRAMLDAGAQTGNMLASIGPCIGPCCFEIGEDTAAELRNCCPDAADFVLQKQGRPHADLTGINRLQLLQAGLALANIEVMLAAPAGCTCCNSRDYFSFRRDGAMSGRHLAIVAPMASA